MTEDDDQKGYTWEAGYADGLNIREVLEEDEGGSIEKSIAKLVMEARKKQRTIEKPSKIRLGIMRYVYVAIDCSRSMTSKVLPPSRFFVTMKGSTPLRSANVVLLLRYLGKLRSVRCDMIIRRTRENGGKRHVEAP